MKKNGKKPVPGNDNIVLFPDLAARLLDKATALVSEKQYREARDLFGKLLELDSGDMKGLYGWAVCSVEMGDYPQAEEAARLLLSGNTPYYYDVFRLYLTILIEKKDYRGALGEIRRLGGHKGLPPESKEFLRQMKNFCEIRLNELTPGGTSGRGMQSADEKSDRQIDWRKLAEADPRDQMLQIRNMTDQMGKENLPEIRQFLLDEKQNPEIKTMLLCAVKESRMADEIDVWKFGKVYRVTFDRHFLHKEFADQIEEQIRKVLDSEDPTLASLAVETERFFTMTVYPRPFDPPSARVWAAVFSIQAAQAGDMDGKTEAMLELFSVSESEFQDACRMVEKIGEYGVR
ncbi:tetratricopeptide repeat protein [Sporolactobacillus shoreae]|uniref:Tetratricopeptide repeat protein n=1 Tax=Sporolactobacillus shoreae TaxID=1465501 RepID=A0A4Z0GSG7_9BACL|nr:tetratricopeptide repeat protein [Sporolactobacillus shoreae]TGA99467.1 tetratricopeptide repeat protein [Sporolactobacillus shoreae]